MQEQRQELLYPFFKKKNRNSLCKIIFTWIEFSGYNYFTFNIIVVFKSLHLFSKCSGMEELTGSKFCNWNPFLSKHSIHGDEWTYEKKSKQHKTGWKASKCLGYSWLEWNGEIPFLCFLWKPFLKFPQCMLQAK